MYLYRLFCEVKKKNERKADHFNNLTQFIFSIFHRIVILRSIYSIFHLIWNEFS